MTRRGGLALVLAFAVPLACSPAPAEPPFPFERIDIDTEYGGNGKPGWVRAGDMDADGDVDLVAGGGEALFVYENDGRARGWRRHGSLDATGRIGANGAVLLDVDGDADLDVVSAQFYGPVGWWENPGPPLRAQGWPFHAFDDQDWFLHDLIPAELDGDPASVELVANFVDRGMESNVRIRWYRAPRGGETGWRAGVIEPGRDDEANNHAGLDVGDVDGDGRPDLAYSNGWYRAPDTPGSAWSWHRATDRYGISNALLRDLDADGDLDLVVSAGHHGRGVYWLEAPSDPRREAWSEHPIAPELLHPECLAVEDLDADGDLDVVTCDLDFERWDREVHRVYVVESQEDPSRWAIQASAPGYPSHLLRLVDVNGDGRLDIVSESAGYSVVSYYENRSGRAQGTTTR